MDDQEELRLQQQYPMWHIRRIPAMDCFMATRLGRPLTQRELYYGLCATVIEDTFQDLRETLSGQSKIEEDL
ncbi:hypothetical protein AGRA3207_005864 [Actinomadura graeca]|uniref:Uncharacterized protein n=1 Tax=Actinomadura graeca TaxID=2750812 RepID=A0ABX8R0E4_9ACTN|nr:hypothetical protein [Actinomadura graeca]QXJ24525.1 hypothetical protein AGRA3207_005864 [Actinomadura graeca]